MGFLRDLEFQPTPPTRGGATICRHTTSFVTSYFNPRPRTGGRPLNPGASDEEIKFQPTPPRGGRLAERCGAAHIGLFQPTPPARGATMLCAAFSSSGRFQPTPPARGATGEAAFTASVLMDFNPRPPCGGRPAPQGHVLLKGVISTHAPRAGGDFCAHKVLKRGVNISTHAPRAGGDVLRQRVQLREGVISTHAPRAGGDRRHRRLFAELPGFQPTPPRGGRHRETVGYVPGRNFNPRPHAGGDYVEL